MSSGMLHTETNTIHIIRCPKPKIKRQNDKNMNETL